MKRWRKPEKSALPRTWRFSMTAAISRPLAGWMGPDPLHRDCAEQGVHGSVRRLHAGPFQLYPGRPVAFGRHAHACPYGGVGWRVSHQGRWRNCRSDRGERSAHGAERRRLRESSPGARTRCGARWVARARVPRPRQRNREGVQLHGAHARRVWPSTYKVFLAGGRGTQIPAVSRCRYPAAIPGRNGP